MSHVVEQIANAFVEALRGATDADYRVTRDRIGSEHFEAETDLPSIDVRIGEDNTAEVTANGIVRSDVEVFVDLYTADSTEGLGPTSHLLELRAQAYAAIMRDAPALTGVANVLRVIPAGADPPTGSEQGSIPTASMRTVFLVHYQHQLTNATR